MKTIYYLYAIICIFLVIILVLFLTTPPEFVTGQPHSEFKTMLKGGGSLSQFTTTKALGLFFGLCTVAMLCGFLILGAIRRHSLSQIRPWLLLASLVYCLVFVITYYADITYVEEGHTRFFMGWPIPTALMIYAMWSSPVLFVLIYEFKFRDWILPVKEEERFYELLADRKNNEQN